MLDVWQFLEVFDIQWLWPSTHSTENWHSTYLCSCNVYTNSDVFFSFCSWVMCPY